VTTGKSRTSALQNGQVVASFGRSYRVELEDGTLVECATRGKRSDIACGDRVSIQHSGDNSGVIEAILPRSTLLYRSDAYKQKLIAANVTQVVIVVAPVPSYYDDLINRCLAACEHAGIAPLLVLNKTDPAEHRGVGCAGGVSHAGLPRHRALGETGHRAARRVA